MAHRFRFCWCNSVLVNSLFYQASSQANITSLSGSPAVCKTGCITTHRHSCTSGQGARANAPKCASTHLHTHVHTFNWKHTWVQVAHFTRMLQQDIKTLGDHIWYGKWITNEYIRAQCRIWAHEVCWRNLSLGAQVCQRSCVRNTEKSSAEVEGSWLCQN